MKKLLIFIVVILQGCIVIKKDICGDGYIYYRELKTNPHLRKVRRNLRNNYRYHQVRPNSKILNLFRKQP